MSQHLVSEKLIPCRLSRNGDNFIAYSRTTTQQKNTPEVLFLTGLRSDMLGTKAQALDHYCNTHDLGFTRFDYYGHGLSSGDFSEGTIGLWLEDTLEIIDRVTEGPLVLVGSSLGGWLSCLAALARPQRIKGIVGIASAPDFTEELMMATFTDHQKRELVSHGRTFIPCEDEELDDFIITHQFIEDGKNHLILEGQTIPIHCPIHLLHGDQDRDVPWDFSKRLLDKVESREATLTLLKGGEHRLSCPHEIDILLNTVGRMVHKSKNVD